MTGDNLHRRRATRETGTSFVVEASAGTGKTSTLVRRILRLVLQGGPGGEPVKMSDIAAITFTEKAAGEMKIRLRQKFEHLRVGPPRQPAPGVRFETWTARPSPRFMPLLPRF